MMRQDFGASSWRSRRCVSADQFERLTSPLSSLALVSKVGIVSRELHLPSPLRSLLIGSMRRSVRRPHRDRVARSSLDLEHDLDELRRERLLDRARPGQDRSSKMCASRPGRGVSTTTRSARKIASVTLWVTKTIVLPVSIQIFWMSRFISSRVKASSAPNGSSIRITSGSSERQRTMLARCCMPPESSRGNFFSNPARPTSSSRPAMRSLIRLRVDLLDLEREVDVLHQVPPGQQVRVLEDHADLRARPLDRRAIEDDLAAGQLVQAGHPPEQRALAAAGRPDDADELALLDIEVDVLQGVHRAG